MSSAKLNLINSLLGFTGHNSGYNKATKEILTAVNNNLLSKLKYFCAKHTECPDIAAFCTRTTDEPCKYRILNPAHEAFQTILKKNGIY